MSSDLEIDCVIDAVHAMTGVWLSGKDAEVLIANVERREELLAHGIIDLNWLARHPDAERHLNLLLNSARLPSVDLELHGAPAAPSPNAGISRNKLMQLMETLSEGPAGEDPMDALARLAADRRAIYRTLPKT